MELPTIIDKIAHRSSSRMNRTPDFDITAATHVQRTMQNASDNNIAFSFEKEGNHTLGPYLNQIIPGSVFSGALADRSIADGSQFDGFTYMLVDSLEPGVDLRDAGVSVIAPDGCPFVPPLTQHSNLRHSPGAKAHMLDRLHHGPAKSVFAESYSGRNANFISVKLGQMEKKTRTLMRRNNERGGTSCRDVTGVVGAAILIMAEPRARILGVRRRQTRKDYLSKCTLLAKEAVDRNSRPNLYRLAQARRLFVHVLAENESPITSGFDAIGCRLQALENGQEGLKDDVKGLKDDVKGLKDDVKDILTKLDSIIDKLDKENNGAQG